ncbi:MAG: CBS domain-containing protein [Candidatus Methanomethylophilaceae archaeon]|nr:CBS domain-containing protein [Candidatus Methanomethylophilaceae archaeon]MBR4180806.1 CBS domain-containing protein [Candidatus Methanomethylophilaceae archaeon]MBR4217365.1 CBS domain-containing protein [Candidatus Methanomethylophilaceae archaeon]
MKLFETLEAMKQEGNKDLTAIDVASKNVVTVQSSDSVHRASEILKSTGYSQLPVLRGEVPVGSISERDIFDMLRQGYTMDQMKVTSVVKVMNESFPIVSDSTPITLVTMLMSDSNAVLVAQKGRIVGLITNADMLKLI